MKYSAHLSRIQEVFSPLIIYRGVMLVSELRAVQKHSFSHHTRKSAITFRSFGSVRFVSFTKHAPQFFASHSPYKVPFCISLIPHDMNVVFLNREIY